MTNPDVTCWTMIHAAAHGDRSARDRFARVYLPVIRAYLKARWRTSSRETDDAAQDVFVECFKDNGLLLKVDPDRNGGFRAFLYGAVQNVARRYESRRIHDRLANDVPNDDKSLSQTFDQAWARALLREAGRVQAELAVTSSARRRVELLRLRFQDGLPIREIATRWGVDSAKVHHEYAAARADFRTALLKVVAFHHPDATPDVIESACAKLLECFA